MTWAHDWTGPYAGAQIGMGFGDNDGSFSYVTPDGFTDKPSLITNAYGVLAGAHLGYNRQLDQWVLGFEASADVTDLNKREQLGWANPQTPPQARTLPSNCVRLRRDDRRPYLFRFSRLAARARRLCLEPPARLRDGRSRPSEISISSPTSADRTLNGNFYFAAAQDRSLWRLGWTGGARRRICDHAALVGARGMALHRFRSYRRDADELLHDGRRSDLLSGRSSRHAEPDRGRREL